MKHQIQLLILCLVVSTLQILLPKHLAAQECQQQCHNDFMESAWDAWHDTYNDPILLGQYFFYYAQIAERCIFYCTHDGNESYSECAGAVRWDQDTIFPLLISIQERCVQACHFYDGASPGGDLHANLCTYGCIDSQESAARHCPRARGFQPYTLYPSTDHGAAFP